MFKLGQKVIWLANDPTMDVMSQRIFEGVVTKIGEKDTIWIDNAHKGEDCLYAAFAYPDMPIARNLLKDVLEMNARHKKESFDMLSRQIDISNEYVRQGLK